MLFWQREAGKIPRCIEVEEKLAVGKGQELEEVLTHRFVDEFAQGVATCGEMTLGQRCETAGIDGGERFDEAVMLRHGTMVCGALRKQGPEKIGGDAGEIDGEDDEEVVGQEIEGGGDSGERARLGNSIRHGNKMRGQTGTGRAGPEDFSGTEFLQHAELSLPEKKLRAGQREERLVASHAA